MPIYDATVNNPELNSPKESKADRDRNFRGYQDLRAEKSGRGMLSGLEIFDVESMTIAWS